MYGNSKGAIILWNNNAFHRRTKHIEIAYHYKRYKIEQGEIKIYYIQTAENIADLYTKPVKRQKFLRIITLLGIDRCVDPDDECFTD